MNPELEKIRQIFLNDVDQETLKHNESVLSEWETSLRDNELFLEWQNHDVTKKIVTQARETYKELAFILANDRRLSEQARVQLWGKQDGCLFIIGLASRDAIGEIKKIQDEIKIHLANATNL